jgi:hypothetical protein
MALKIVNPVRRLIFSVPSDEFPGEFDDMYSAEVGEVIVKSDLSYVEAPEKVVQLSIPAHVECINPGLFVDFVNLVEVEIRGDVYGVEWVAGIGNGTWSASLTPYTLVEELKRGKGRIEIHRSRF